jgi:hypothetical protein
MVPVAIKTDNTEAETKLEEFWKDLEYDTSGNNNVALTYDKLLDSLYQCQNNSNSS